MNKTDFKPHMMYDPKTGKGVRVKTYEEHLALKKKGYRVKEIDGKGDFVSKLKKIRPKVVFNALHGKFGEDGFY